MLTVLFATRNGQRSLPLILEAHAALEPPTGGWKLVAVDNGSTDATRQVLDRYCDRLPLTIVDEPVAGKNRAINTGLRHVEGDLVVFTDDDVFPRPDWLVHFRSCADANPGATMFGGPIVARWEAPPPQWVRTWVPQGPAFGLTKPDLIDGDVHPGQIFGGNLAVRTSVFESGHTFDTTVGPRAGSYSMGGETQLLLRLHAAGHRARFIRAATVEHLIRAYQLERAWLLQRAVRFGRSIPRMAVLYPVRSMPRWFGVPRHLFRELAERSVAAVHATLVRDREREFRTMWQLAHAWGRTIEWWRIGRELRAAPREYVTAAGRRAKFSP